MSRYWSMLSTALLIAISIGCNRSTLREEMTGDSTWETSAGDDTWEDADRPPKSDDTWDPQNAPAEDAPPATKPEPESAIDQPYPRLSTGVINRDELVPVLDGGLGRFLQHVQTEPDFHRGAFVGFRIVSLFPGEPAFASLDLRVGDTVTRINGKPIERPEQAAAVWESLRTASDLVVDYRRNGEKYALRFTIVDES